MFALGAVVACLAVCLVAHVSPVLCERYLTISLVSLAAKASCGRGVFGCVAFFLLFVVFAWFGLVSLFCLCFVACLRSFTDWCTAHRQQSREQKILRSLEVLICSGRVPWSGPFGSLGSLRVPRVPSGPRLDWSGPTPRLGFTKTLQWGRVWPY